MWTTWWGAAFAIALWDWFAVALSRRRMGYFTKPAVIVALLGAALAAASASGKPNALLSWVTVALVFSLAGDVFLMLPKERFTWGLGAFLLAHVAYLIAFNLTAPTFTAWTAGLAIGVGIAAGKFYERLIAALDAADKGFLKKPVAAYTLAISLMVLSALLLPFRADIPRSGAFIVAGGAVLFFASDALLTWNRFVKPVPRGQLFTRILYHLGQLSIVLGVILIAGVPLPS